MLHENSLNLKSSTVLLQLFLRRIPLKEEQRLLFMQSIHRVQQSLRRRQWPQLPVHLYDLHDLYNKSRS